MSFLRRRELFATAAVSLSLAAAPAAYAQAQYDFNLPSQSLAESLRAVGRKASVNVVFDPAAVSGRQAPALHGTYSPQQALGRLIDGAQPFVGLHLAICPLQVHRVGAVGALQRAAMGQLGHQGDGRLNLGHRARIRRSLKSWIRATTSASIRSRGA